MRPDRSTKRPKRARVRAAQPSALEPVAAARVHPGFEERTETTNEPLERPAPPGEPGEHDFGSVAPGALEGPATPER